jgi:hypothetical protein
VATLKPCSLQLKQPQSTIAYGAPRFASGDALRFMILRLASVTCDMHGFKVCKRDFSGEVSDELALRSLSALAKSSNHLGVLELLARLQSAPTDHKPSNNLTRRL